MLVARRRARRLATAAPELGTACAEVLARLALATPCWPPPPERLRVLHGDFGLDHLILGPGVCAAIDWDDWRVGDPAEDAGRLLASLRHAATRHPEWASAADRAALMFRRVYLAMTPQAAEHLAFYESLDCLRVARRAAQHGDPAGRARAAVMLAAAANALGQG
jgi:aminoglycoside phosphotransferase (APT) family kinase protein